MLFKFPLLCPTALFSQRSHRKIILKTSMNMEDYIGHFVHFGALMKSFSYFILQAEQEVVNSLILIYALGNFSSLNKCFQGDFFSQLSKP